MGYVNTFFSVAFICKIQTIYSRELRRVDDINYSILLLENKKAFQSKANHALREGGRNSLYVQV